MFKSIFKKQDGATLVLALSITFVLTILSISLVYLLNNETRMVARNVHKSEAYYLARAGADSMVKYFKKQNIKQVRNFFEDIMGNTLTMDPVVLEEDLPGEIEVTVQYNSDDSSLDIISVGTIDNMTERINVGLVAEGLEDSELDHGVFALEELNMGSDSKIKGTAGSNANTYDGYNLIYSARIEDQLDVGPDSGSFINYLKYYVNSNQVYKLPEEKRFSMPVFPEFPVLPNRGNLIISSVNAINQSGHYPRIIINGDEDNVALNINLTSEVTDIVIDELDINEGDIQVNGDGLLNLYIKDSFDMADDCKILRDSEQDHKKIRIFYSGAESFNVKGDAAILGSVYSENGDINVAGSGSIRGDILNGGGNINFDGENFDGQNVVRLIYAPHSEIKLDSHKIHYYWTEGDRISGTVVGNKVTLGKKFVVDDFNLQFDDSAFDFFSAVRYERVVWRTQRSSRYLDNRDTDD